MNAQTAMPMMEIAATARRTFRWRRRERSFSTCSFAKSSSVGIGNLARRMATTGSAADRRTSSGSRAGAGGYFFAGGPNLRASSSSSERWRFLLSPVKTFNTVADETDYFIGSGAPPAGSTNTGLGLTSVREIKADSVIDRTNNILLHPSEEKPILDAFNDSGHPKIWRLDQDTSTVLNLYPPPDGVYAIEFRYYEQFNVVDELTDNLQIPEDYKDVMCAGVNWLASKYLKQDSDAQHWFSVYQQGKVSMIGDYNQTPRVDFMRPDGTGSLVVTDVRTSLP